MSHGHTGSTGTPAHAAGPPADGGQRRARGDRDGRANFLRDPDGHVAWLSFGASSSRIRADPEGATNHGLSGICMVLEAGGSRWHAAAPARPDGTIVMLTRSDAPNLRPLIVAGMVGNAMEWYDFSIYGTLAPLLARLFFPTTDPSVALLATFAIFAVGFFARPFGGVVFGQVGDRLG